MYVSAESRSCYRETRLKSDLFNKAIYNVIRQLAAAGTAIILVSSELPEVMALSDRLVVMRNKTIADIYSCENLTQTQVMTAATGVR